MTLALIPARGGSKGIPRKNVGLIAGKPLIAWTIEAALAARGVDRVVVSTDDPEIADVALQWGAEVPFMRPAELATDTAPGIAPVLHAMSELPGHNDLVLLQPTSPLRSAALIEQFLAFVGERSARSAVSVSRSTDHPAWMFTRDGQARILPILAGEVPDRRQDLPPVYVLNGAMYWAKYDWLRQHEGFMGDGTCGFVMEDESSIDIDTPADWARAEASLLGRAR